MGGKNGGRWKVRKSEKEEERETVRERYIDSVSRSEQKD